MPLIEVELELIIVPIQFKGDELLAEFVLPSLHPIS
jgi:hypothetical protein